VPLFRRKQAADRDPRPAIAGFWAWWAGARPEMAAALAEGDPQRVAGALTQAVGRIHPDLDWALAAGLDGARHALVVSAGGRHDLRAVAERWWLAAPPADAEFEYHPVRRRDPAAVEGVLDIDDYEVPLVEFVAGTRYDEQRGRFDLAIHHPLFPLLDKDSRARAAFLALDTALGEDDVERWVGAVDVTPDQPVDAVPLASLGPLVDGLRPRDDAWVTFTGATRKGPVVGVVRRPFSRVDRPLADTHVAVSLPYEPGGEGMPSAPDFAKQVDAWERRALDALGGDGDHAVLVGHETGLGRCLVHLYVDGLEVDPAAIDPLLPEWSMGPARRHTTPDPAWREIGHLLA
jgi:hypothetical protein